MHPLNLIVIKKKWSGVPWKMDSSLCIPRQPWNVELEIKTLEKLVLRSRALFESLWSWSWPCQGKATPWKSSPLRFVPCMSSYFLILFFLLIKVYATVKYVFWFFFFIGIFGSPAPTPAPMAPTNSGASSKQITWWLKILTSNNSFPCITRHCLNKYPIYSNKNITLYISGRV